MLQHLPRRLISRTARQVAVTVSTVCMALLDASLVAAQATESAAHAFPREQREAREILRQLVNINSTSGSAGVRRLAVAMAARLRAAGYPAADVQLLGPTPALTSLVARLRGRRTGLKPILLMAHMDAVTANRADWPTDPFVFSEKDGWYYGRGSEDNKAGVATIVSNLVRWKREGWVPDRDIVAVLTADRAPRRRARQPLAAMALMLMLVFVVAVALGVRASN